MTGWRVSPSPELTRKMKKYKSTRIPKRYSAFVRDVQMTDDPGRLGVPKTGRHKHCFGFHLTKSISLIYQLSYDRKLVYVLDIGDHKELYMRQQILTTRKLRPGRAARRPRLASGRHHLTVCDRAFSAGRARFRFCRSSVQRAPAGNKRPQTPRAAPGATP